MDRDEIEEIIRKVLGKSNSNIAHPSSQYAAGGLGSLNNMNHEEFLRENLNSYFLQKMQQQQQASAPLPEPSASQSAAPKNGTEDIKVALSLPDVEGLMKFFIENMSSNQEEKAKRLALEKEAQEMRRMIRSFEDMSKKSEAAAAQKKLDAFEDFNALKSQKSSNDESLQEFLARCLSDIMLKEVPTKKKVLNDPKWFPGTSKNPEYSNTNSSAEKPMFKDMLKNSSNDGLPQQGPNFSPQPGPSGQFQGGPNFQPPPYQEHAPPPYHQNPYPMPGVPYPWPGHGGPPHPPHMMGYGAPGPFGWQGPPSGYQHPRGPYPGPMPPQKQKQQQNQQQNQPKQKQQQNQPKQKQPNQQQNQPKQKQPNQQQKQPNQQTQQQNQQKQQNQPKQNQKNQQNQVPGNVPPTQEMSKKKKNTQNQEPNKKGAQPKLTVPVGSCVNLSPNSSASCNLGSDNLGGIKLSPKEINELKQTIKLMNENVSKNNTNNNLGGETNVGKKKKRSKGKSGGGGAAAASNDNDDENDDDSGSGEEGKKEGGSDEAAKKVVPPGQGKKKKNKNKNNEGGSQSPSSGFSLYVGDRWPTLADINSGRLKLDQPVKNILMVAKTPSGDVSATPKMIQDMLVFNKLHPNAMLVFTSD